MLALYKKWRKNLALLVFFLMFIIGVLSSPVLDCAVLAMIALKAGIGFVIFWILSLIILDVLFKTIIFEIKEKSPEPWQQGLVAHFAQKEEREDVSKSHKNGNEKSPKQVLSSVPQELSHKAGNKL